MLLEDALISMLDLAIKATINFQSFSYSLRSSERPECKAKGFASIAGWAPMLIQTKQFNLLARGKDRTRYRRL